MNKEQKIKTYRLLVNISLSAFCIVDTLQETAPAGEYTREQLETTKKTRRALKDCATELSLPTCSINKVETILTNLVDHE